MRATAVALLGVAVLAPAASAAGASACWQAASLLKALVLVAYLRQPAIARRALTPSERALLEPMIQHSDDAPVGVLVRRMTPGALGGRPGRWA